jgi:exo-beta-1,3-glucanase (GH17 family)
MMRFFMSPLSSVAAVVGAVALIMTGPCLSFADQDSTSGPAKDGVRDGTDQVRPRYAVAYSAYRAGQHPDQGQGAKNPTDEQILEDLRILTHDLNFGLIRLYDSRENSGTVLRLIREHKLRLNVMLGIWLGAEVSNHRDCPWLDEPIPKETLAKNKANNQLEIQRGIELANEYSDIVIAVSVGNEALVSWTDHTKELDFITVHSYAIWAERDVDEALAFTAGNIEAVRKALPGFELIIGEVGWATTATEFGDRASEENQRRYFKEVTEWAAKLNVTTFWFEAFDEDWKGDTKNPNGAEKHFGLFTVDRKPKLVMQELYPNLR